MNYKSLLAKPAVSLAALATVGLGAGLGAIASADTAANTNIATQSSTSQTRPNHAPGVFGKITAISGNTITVARKGFGPNATEATYTVDATNATIMKGSKGQAPTTSSLSALAVGDMVGVEGTVSGTSVTATRIIDGFGGPGMGRGFRHGHGVEGTVSAVSGNTITITNQDGTTYTIDASSAKVSKIVDEPVSSIQVGDRIDAQGTVSGSNVTAKHIMDGIPQMGSAAPQTTATQ